MNFAFAIAFCNCNWILQESHNYKSSIWCFLSHSNCVKKRYKLHHCRKSRFYFRWRFSSWWTFHRAALSRNAFKIWPFLKLFLYISQNSILRFPKMSLCGFCYNKNASLRRKAKSIFSMCRAVKSCKICFFLTPE